MASAQEDNKVRILDAYNYATIVIALRRDGQICHIQDGSEREPDEDIPNGYMTCS